MGEVGDDNVIREAMGRAERRLRRLAAGAVDVPRASAALRDEVVDYLRRVRPQDGLLSGDRYRHPDRLDRTRIWLLKPLEVVTTEAGHGWATHLALVVEGGVHGGGIAFSNRPPLLAPVAAPPAPAEPWRLAVSGGIDRDGLIAVQQFDRQPRPMAHLTDGLLAVLDGTADGALHFGGWEWDAAAAVAVARSAGLSATSIDGTPLRFNQPAPVLDGVLIASTVVARRLASVLVGRSGRE